MTLLLLQFGALSVLTIIFIQILIKFPMSKAFPTNRGMHTYEMPSSGGIGILASYICISIFAYFYHGHPFKLSSPIFALTLIAILGYIDDRYRMTKSLRFLIQGIISLVLISSTFQLSLLEIILWTSFFLFFINIYNFMDGIDGLAVSQSIYILISLSLLQNFYSIGSLILFIIPLIIFLIFNISPSKIFLGNSGSYMLGLFIVILIFNSSYTVSIVSLSNHIITCLILLTVFIADGLYTLSARFFYKLMQSSSILISLRYITTPHNKHNYQILTKKYNKHNKVNIYLMSYNLFWCLPLAYLSQIYTDYIFLFAALSYLPYISICYLNHAGKE